MVDPERRPDSRHADLDWLAAIGEAVTDSQDDRASDPAIESPQLVDPDFMVDFLVRRGGSMRHLGRTLGCDEAAVREAVEQEPVASALARYGWDPYLATTGIIELDHDADVVICDAVSERAPVRQDDLAEQLRVFHPRLRDAFDSLIWYLIAEERLSRDGDGRLIVGPHPGRGAD